MSELNPTEPRVPDWLLERMRQHELDPDEAARLREEGGRAVDEALASLEEDDRRFLERHPVNRVVPQLRAGMVQKPSKTGWIAWLVPVAGLALVPLLIVPTPQDETVEVTRDKGDGPVVKVWRREGAGPVRLGEGSPVRANDVLQLGVGGTGGKFAVLLSIDGRGVVTRHVPEEGHAAAKWPGSGEIRLPRSYTLDDAPGFERFVLVLHDTPFDAATALEAAWTLGAERARPLPLPESFEQVSFVVRKEDR